MQTEKRHMRGYTFLFAAVTLVTLTSGCATNFSASDDVAIEFQNSTVYLIARSDGVARALCAKLGGDIAKAEARNAAEGGRLFSTGRVKGCYTQRDIIVCPAGDDGCTRHEEKHRADGPFHPD